ncbi:MAG TPA: J domain-containing protein [Pantanalinema sp.]
MAPKGAPTYYDRLGVAREADEDEIRLAYRAMAKRHHPDRPGGDPLRMAQLNEAYETLSDARKRSRYDATIKPSAPSRQARPANAPFVDPRVFYQTVFAPVDAALDGSIGRLLDQLDDLSGDPYDDVLMEAFEAVVAEARRRFDEGGRRLAASAVPWHWQATIALYEQGMRQVGDALEEFETFPLNYHLDHLVDGRSIMLGGSELMTEARERLRR